MATKAKKVTVLEQAKKQSDYVIDARRVLHRIPELGWQEDKTINVILDQIEQIKRFIPYELRITEYKGGICVDVDVDERAERIMLRADIDGLPIEEQTELPFASVHDGVMHACGHDCHSAMLLGALKALATCEAPTKNLRFVWQRAEEVFDRISGASILIEEGITKGITQVHGLHIATPQSPGLLLSRPGVMMANAAHIKMQIKCTGGHVMRPELGSNAIDISTDIQNAMRNFAVRTLGVQEPVAFVPTVSHSGVIENIMPNEATIGYSIRNFLPPEQMHTFLLRLRSHIEAIVSAYPDAKLATFTFNPGYPTLSNDEHSYRNTEKTLKASGLQTKLSPLLFCGEDFSYYAQKVPGSFWMLGAKKGPGYDHHTPFFDPEESILWKGVAYWLAIISA